MYFIKLLVYHNIPPAVDIVMSDMFFTKAIYAVAIGYEQWKNPWLISSSKFTQPAFINISEYICLWYIYIFIYLSWSIYIYPPWKSIYHHIYHKISPFFLGPSTARPSTGRSHLGGLSRLIFAASPVGPKARCHVGCLPRDSAPRAEKPSDTKALGGNQPVVRSAWDQRDLASLIWWFLRRTWGWNSSGDF